MGNRTGLLAALGGEAGCRRLSAEFYARVQQDAVLWPLFPGKSLRCATEEFAAFLIQFLGGDEAQTQKRWWLSLRESHSRFAIEPEQRAAWLKQMKQTLEAATIGEEVREALQQFFVHGAAYVAGVAEVEVEHDELAARWAEQRLLDEAIGLIAKGEDDQKAIELTRRFASRPVVFIGLLARMVQAGRSGLIQFVVDNLNAEPVLLGKHFAGRSLLHIAAGAGSLPVVDALVGLGARPDDRDRGGHTALYCAANECASWAGPEIVRLLVQAGADVNASGGAMRATALHMAARRGFVGVAGALLDCGADIEAADRNGDTPLTRALKCRKPLVAALLMERGARGQRGLS